MSATVTRSTIDLAGLDVPWSRSPAARRPPADRDLGGARLRVRVDGGGAPWTRAWRRRELRGRVRAVPVLNLPAFRARSPFVVPDDGKNLNRCFPGDASGTLAERLAYDTFRS